MSASKRLSMEERKQEIMQAASKLIIEKGFANTTMEDIVAGTTMSKGGVYHYYKNTVDIFKDLMLDGIQYRNRIIKEHLDEQPSGREIQFIAKELVDRILDDNPYMSLYVEFLIEKKRNPQLNMVFEELKKQSLESLKTIMDNPPKPLLKQESYDMLTDFLNGMILASNVLNARENFSKNRILLEKMFVLIFE